MDRYNEMYNKSKQDQITKKRKIVTVDKKKFATATLEAAAIIMALLITTSTGFNFFNDQHMRTEMAIMASSEMIEAGFSIAGTWDDRYYLLDEIDLFDLYLTMPEESFNGVLDARGYLSLEDYLVKNNFSSFDEWKDVSIAKYLDEKKEEKSKGGK